MIALIIEDSPEIVETVALCIQIAWPDGHILATAEGSKGLEFLRNVNVDIVVLDINLPDIDGFQVLTEARKFTKTPIVMLTVRSSERDKQRGMELGASDYIVKPFKSKDLIRRLAAAVQSTSPKNPVSAASTNP